MSIRVSNNQTPFRRNLRSALRKLLRLARAYAKTHPAATRMTLLRASARCVLFAPVIRSYT